MLNKLKQNKAFTLIELIVVIAVIGILVLLAAPKFLGYTKDAKAAQVMNDVKAYEDAIIADRIDNEEYFDGWSEVDVAVLSEHKNSGTLYDKGGLVESDLDSNDEYFAVPKDKEIVKSKLNGDFFVSEGGKVYYHDNGGEESEPNEPSDEDLGMVDDFKWVPDTTNELPFSYPGPNGDLGYFKYTGSMEGTIEIPHVIQGVKMTSYYGMFGYPEAGLTFGDIEVISTNRNITNMSYMFAVVPYKSLTLKNFDTSGVINMDAMFGASGVQSGGSKLTLGNKFNTSNVKSMLQMFGESFIDFDLGENFDTSNVENMSLMFASTQTSEINLGDKFNTSSVTDMSGMFGAAQASEINFGDKFNTSSVTDMSGMFVASQVKTLDLRSFDIKNDTNVRDMFAKGENQAPVETIKVKDKSTAEKLINEARATEEQMSYPGK